MNKILLTLFSAIIVFSSSSAQSLYVPGGFTSSGVGTSTSGTVGIGISNPGGQLHLHDSPYWSSYNFGAALIIDGPHNNAIGIFDGGNSNPLALANSGGTFTIAKMPPLGNTSTAPVSLMTLSDAGASFTGNVGVGTTTPATALEVAGSGTAIFRNMNYGTAGYINGAVNIFRNNADAANVNTVLNLGNYWNSASSTTSILAIDFRGGDGNGVTGGSSPAGRIKVQTAWVSPYMDFDLGGSTVMRLKDGNVGIGTSSPDARLTVNGQIHATEVNVTTTVPTPDYVFEKSYELRSLEEVKSYIDENKHLPEVPSAADMEKNGIQLGEMNMLLLKKVEELTLYIIEMKQENNRRIDELKREIDELKK